MIVCGHYHEEDGTCGRDGGDPCMDTECPFGLYATEEPGQDDMFESSSCQFFIIKKDKRIITGFNCTMPDWA